ncbi:uncharacterized protein LOC129281952 isoform X2 [Lytechinus pictus]|uniref:uncharacterized protein LOC129281952 isoform X2 n=1 Tax=Lytechinus pictus TaxID=7653 RepID=UPI0030B9ED74
MKILVTFVALFAATSALNPAAIYRSKCSEGASYWCQSASHADECGAVEYCIQNYWRGKLVEESTSCSDCEAFINGVQNILEQTSVQTEIIDAAKQACVVMESLEAICQTMVENLGAEVLQKLVTELSSDEVCKVLQFCQEKKTSLQTNVNDDELCTLCKDAMTEANSFLSDVTIQQEVEDILLKFCPLLSEIFPNCVQVVEDDIPSIFQFLIAYLNPDTCSEIGLCPGTEELRNLLVQLKKLKNREGADLCSTCKSTVGTIDSMLSNAAIQQAIILELDQLCYQFGPLTPVCIYAVKTYTKEIITAVISYLNPDSFCHEFRFCSSDENVYLGNDPCADCKTFIGDIDGMLTNETVQNIIVDAVDKVCEVLGNFSDQCQSYVDQYGYLVFDFLASELSPQEVCTDINFCSSTQKPKTKMNLYHIFKVVEKRIHVKGPSKVCTDCEQFAADVQSKLNDPNVQNTIVNAIESVCALFGQSSDECRSYVEQYGDLVIQFIVSSIDPDTICNDLGFCMSSKKPMVLRKLKGPSKVCTDCGKFFSDVQMKLNDPYVQNTIVNAIENACTLFGPNADECRSYVEQYGDLVIQFVISSIDPSTVCNDLGFCMSLARPPTPKQFKEVQGPSKVCTDCDQFFTDVQTKLNDPNVEATIVNAIMSVCSLFGQNSDECRAYVAQYGDLVIQFIVSSVDPDTVCNDLGFCMSITMLRQRLSLLADPCTDCKTFIADVQGMLMNETVESMITAELVQVCSYFGSFADQCQTYVSQYATLVYSLLASELNPDQICATIDFCPAQTHLKFQTPRVDNGEVCTLCQNVVGAVETYISSQANQNFIVQELDSLVCANLPSILSLQCKSLVKTYTPMIINLILTYFEPKMLCTEIKLCPGVSSLKINGDSEFCDDCKKFMGDIQALLTNTTFQQGIIKELEGLCVNAGSFEAECKLLIQTYAPTVFAMIVSELDPTTACTAIQLCPGGSAPMVALTKTDPQFCSACKSLLTDVVSLLSNQTFENEILAQVEKLCAMAGSLQAECELLVKTYGLAAFSYLEAELDPNTVCTEIGLCPGNTAPATKAISLVAVQPMATLQAAQPIVPKKTSSKASSDEECTFCKWIVGAFLYEFNNNETEQEFLDDITELCNVFSNNDTRRECHNYIETYGSLIFNLFLDNLSAEQVCQTIGACTSLMDLKPMKHLKEVLLKLPRDDTFCTLCKIGVGELETILSSNKSKEEIKQEVEKLLCGNLPSPINTQCLSFMSIYGDVLVQLVIDQLDPSTFCKDVGLCDANKKELKSKLPPLKASEDCVLCEFIVAELDKYIKENSTEEEIREALKKVCNDLPESIRSKCDSFLEEHAEQFVDYLVEQNPKVLCSALYLCDSEKKVPPPPPVKDSSDCILCEFIVEELDKYVEKNSTEEEIREALKKVCNDLPESIRSECDSFLEEHTEQFVKYLLEENPKVLCSALYLCSSGKLNGMLKKLKVQDTEGCILCEYVMYEVEKLLNGSTTVDEIEKALDDVCDVLPSSEKTECTEFVNAYTPLIISYITQELSPKSICTMLGECDTAKPKIKKPLASTECTLCEFAMSELDTILSENATQEEIAAALEKLCDMLPSTIRQECDAFVTTYEPEIIKLLLTMSPDQVCAELGLCTSSFKVLLGSIECDLCQTAVREFMLAIQEPSVTKEIVAIVNETCPLLPDDLKAECFSYVDQYGDLVTEFIAQFFDPITTCTLIDACPYPDNAPRTPKRMLGRNECTRGPGYWCASKENAVQCNMVEHCKRHAWN